MSKAAQVTSADFDSSVLQSEIPVLVDFYADWCGPCRQVAPEIDAVSEQLEGKARVYKLNVDEFPDVESRYGVKTIPTLIIFKDGAVVDTIKGAYPRKVIAERILAHV